MNTRESVAIFVPLIVATPTILATIAIRGLAVLSVIYLVRHEQRLGHAGLRFWSDLLIVSGVILLALLAHLTEIAVWVLGF